MSFLNDFFQQGLPPANAISGYYNYSLVALSYLIATVASYIALDFSARLRREHNRQARRPWLLGGAFAMGAGIWSMHFIGMLAFVMPMPMTYEPVLTALSMLAAIISSGLVLFLLQSETRQTRYLIVGGIFSGLGIAGMHYIGMSAMLDMSIRYQPALFFLSIGIAIFASEAALWLILQSNQGTQRQQIRLKLISALIMGFAICGMHYTGMSAAVFTSAHDMSMLPEAAIDSHALVYYVTGITGFIFVIALIVSTSRQLMLGAVEKERNFLNAILHNLSDGILACDINGTITVVNKVFQRMTGLREMRGNAGDVLFFQPNNETPIPATEQPLIRVLQGESIHQLELELQTIDNSRRYVIIDGDPIYNNDQEKTGAVIAVHDVTEQKKLEGQLFYQATHDALTNLPGRILLMDRIDSAIAQAKRNNNSIAVIFIDLDHFKEINDNYGHSEGDRLLKTMSERMTQVIRASDTVSRLGGDEFIILLGSLDNETTVVSILHKLMQALAQDFRIGDQVINMTASVGVSTYPKDGEDPETLLKRADIAMYRSKTRGRNAFQFYAEEMNISSMKRLEKELALQNALKLNQFSVHYQPVFDLANESITGVEALLRWEHPDLGSVPPGEFISIAEELDLIIPIGAWVMKTACAQNKAWQSQGLPNLKIAINVSGKQLSSPDFLETVRACLDETQLEAEYLELEIRESVILESPDQVIQSLHALKKLGIHIALDDFGTGYSSLGYLAQLPINKVKIDRSFISQIDHSLKKSAMVLAIIGMASSLKLKVAADGAETENEMTFLRFNRCDQVQGFYLCNPLTAEACTEFLHEYKRSKGKNKA
ncbi:EAL domain-containing protein [Legionella sp. CNM-4043-24]|uniref:EAL domain-containing protein n=1 Tax=Legionella sp. CNM-4043-24 TaxID=3421646 RepID=UPI00403AA43C